MLQRVAQRAHGCDLRGYWDQVQREGSAHGATIQHGGWRYDSTFLSSTFRSQIYRRLGDNPISFLSSKL